MRVFLDIIRLIGHHHYLALTILIFLTRMETFFSNVILSLCRTQPLKDVQNDIAKMRKLNAAQAWKIPRW